MLEFYSLYNDFVCTEDLFAFTPLSEIIEYEKDREKNWFYFSEYMIFSEMWGLRKTEGGKFEIFNACEQKFVLTSSLHHFLAKFLEGDVFGDGGLNEWLEKKIEKASKK